MLTVVAEKTRELVAAHALAWKRVKEGERPVVTEQTTGIEIDDRETDAQEETPTLEKLSTAAQGQLIYSLSQRAGLTEDDLARKIQADYECDLPEALNYNQAATLIVGLGQKERKRFEEERLRS